MEVCKVCGMMVDILTNYHCETHGLTKEEYRKQYGSEKKAMPFTYGKSDYCDAKDYEIKKRIRLNRGG
jgi:hypothetical protein